MSTSPLTPKTSPQEWARRARRACMQVFGMPDYSRYLEHLAAHHPEQKAMSEPEFHRAAIDRKYGKSGPRCC